MLPHNFCVVGVFDSRSVMNIQWSYCWGLWSPLEEDFPLSSLSGLNPSWTAMVFSWRFQEVGCLLTYWRFSKCEQSKREQKQSCHLSSYLILEARSESVTLTHTQEEEIRTWIPGCAITGANSRCLRALGFLGQLLCSRNIFYTLLLLIYWKCVKKSFLFMWNIGL